MSSPAYATPQSKFHSYQNPYKTESFDATKTNQSNSSVNRFSPLKENSLSSTNQTKSQKKIIHDLPSGEKHYSSTFKHITQAKNEETLEFSSSLGRRERKVSENQHKLVKSSSTNPETASTTIVGKRQIFSTPVENVAALQTPQNIQPIRIQREREPILQQPSRQSMPIYYEYIDIIFNENQLKPAGINQNRNQLTWTKYLSLQFKNQELIKQLRFFKEKLISAQNMIKFIEQEKNQMERFFIQQIDNIKYNHQKEIFKINKENQTKINEKNECIKNLINKLTSQAIDKFDEQTKKYLSKIQQENIFLTQNYNEKSDQLAKINIELQDLRQTVQRLQSREKSYKQSIKKMYEELANVTNSLSFKNKNSYQVIIKAQLSEIGDIRKNSQLLSEENGSLREKISNLQRQLQNAHSQLSVEDLKQKTEKHNLITEFGIEVTNRSNQIQILKRKLSTLQDKYKLSANDIKAKDEFFRTHLVGRVDEAEMKNYINNLLGKYIQKFSIQTHSHNECKQAIDDLKKKVELYEQHCQL